MDRRTFLKILGAGLTAPALGGLYGCPGGGGGTNPLTLLTGQPLAIPPLYEGTLDNTGTRVFDLRIAPTAHRFFQETLTPGWAVNAPGGSLSFLGPTLKLTRGEKVSIRYTNGLNVTTTMHGHGMHVPAAMDGGPHQTIAPGATWAAEYTVSQPACTGWYHPHYMGRTAEHVYQGLAGLIIVEDATSQALALPSTYGVDDVPLVLQDRFFDADGRMDYSPSTMEIMRGYRGDVFLTNGQVRPRFTAGEGLLRLRLLNGSNAGIYRLSLSSGAAFSLIATDNGLLAQPVSVTSVLLSPGERVEIVLDLNGLAGQQVSLQLTETVTARQATVLDVAVSTTAAPVKTLPTTLATLNLPDPATAVRTRTFSLDMLGPGRLGINGQAMDLNRIDVQVPLNDLEIWEITNGMPIPHNFHVHATHFIPLDRNGDAAQLTAWERNAYKDTIFMPANSTARILVRMTDYTDAVNPYMFHCHILEHEDAGMMGQFTVV